MSGLVEKILALPMTVGRAAAVGSVVPAVTRLLRSPAAVRRRVREATSAQVWFTGVEALPVVALVGFLFSGALMGLGYSNLRALGAESHFGVMMRTAMVGELAPMLTAMVVAARSGTAITTELAAMRLRDEIDAMRVHGIDPEVMLVLPRLAGVWISTVVLSAIFAATVYGGCAILAPALGHGQAAILSGLLDSLRRADLLLLLVKSSAFGVVIPLVTTHHGMTTARELRALPQTGSRAVLMCFLLVFALDALLSILVLT